ncbi:hypothetical protein Pcinc_002488, partial [Petrolisthes cinctipes]
MMGGTQWERLEIVGETEGESMTEEGKGRQAGRSEPTHKEGRKVGRELPPDQRASSHGTGHTSSSLAAAATVVVDSPHQHRQHPTVVMRFSLLFILVLALLAIALAK